MVDGTGTLVALDAAFGDLASNIGSRDRTILTMLAHGDSPATIAHRLGVAESAVWARRHALCSRFGVFTNAELISVAIRGGVIE